MPKHPKPPILVRIWELPDVRVCDLYVPVEMATSRAAHTGLWDYSPIILGRIYDATISFASGRHELAKSHKWVQSLSLGFCSGSRSTARSCLAWHSDHKFCIPRSSVMENFHMCQRRLCHLMHAWIPKNSSNPQADTRSAGEQGDVLRW